MMKKNSHSAHLTNLCRSLFFIFLLLNVKQINSFILFNKANKYIEWFKISYELYNKTNKLVTFKKKYVTHPTNCTDISENTFFYPQFKTTIKEKLFHKRLKFLQRAWKSWNVSPTYEWAREYSIILFNLYKTIFEEELSILTKNKKSFLKKFSIETFWLYINSVNNQILSLPLEAILQTIDLLAEAIPIFFDHYDTEAKQINFVWIKKYWWAIAITIIPLWLKVMIIFKNYYQHEHHLTGINTIIGMNQLGTTHGLMNMPTHPLSKIKTQVDNKPDSVPHI